MSDFLDMQAFLGQVRAAMPQVLPQEPTVRPPNQRLQASPQAQRDNVDNMPVFDRPGFQLEGGGHVNGPGVSARVSKGQNVPLPMLDGMQPQDIVEAFMLGEFLKEPEAPPHPSATSAPTADPWARENTFVPHRPGSPEGPNPTAIPGTPEHPVEQRWGRTDDVVRQLGDRYVAPMFDQPDGSAMSPEQAAEMIAGQLTARRMRLMAEMDPSLGDPMDPAVWAAMPKGPSL